MILGGDWQFDVVATPVSKAKPIKPAITQNQPVEPSKQDAPAVMISRGFQLTIPASSKKKINRPQCNCKWQVWEEPLRDDEGNLIDEAGHRTTRPVMVWREQGEPCLDCLTWHYNKETDVCAEGRCKQGRNCSLHQHRYTDPPCFACGHYHHEDRRGCEDDRKCDCPRVVAWPDTYDLPESADPKNTRAINPYHRGNAAQVFLRMAARREKQAQAQAEYDDVAILPMFGPEAERYWGTLSAKLSALSTPEAITAMARRILTRQAEDYHPDYYGEGLDGDLVTLDPIESEERLTLLQQERVDNKSSTSDDDEETSEDAAVDWNNVDWSKMCSCCESVVCENQD